MAQDAELRKYLDEVLKQMRLWIEVNLWIIAYVIIIYSLW